MTLRRLVTGLMALTLIALLAGPVAGTSPATAKEARYRAFGRIIGHSADDRPIKAWFRGDPKARRVLLVIGQMHGNEKAGIDTVAYIRKHLRPRRGTAVWLIASINPDGRAKNTRRNAHGVDLNRNWPTSGWSGAGRGSLTYGGPRKASEPETRAMMRFLRKVKPDYIASLHQPFGTIGRTGKDKAWEARLKRLLGMPLRHLGVGTPSGKTSPTLTGWYNRYLGKHGTATTIELSGSPSKQFRTRKAARAIMRAAKVL